VLQPITGIPLLGGNGGDGGVTKVVPNLYYSIKISDRLSAGIGINAPFGLATKYDDTWVGRYHAIESDLLSVNINPSIAYRIGDHLSVGAGFNAMYIKAKLTNAIDYGTIDAVGGFSPAIPPGTFRLTPQRSDGSASLEGDSWGLGFNVGLLYEFTKDTRLGVAYRSRVKQTIEGDAEFFNTPAALAPLPAFKNTSAQAEITLPDSFSVSFAHSFNPQWTVMADFTWTNWSLFKELRVHFDNPSQPDSVTTENWQDSYRYSLGVTFKPTNAWTLRTGFAYDTSAVSSAQFRTPRIPDSYRTWLAFGLSYKLSKTIGIDAGYSHLWISDPAIDQNPVGENALRGGLKGSFDAHIDIIAAQLNVAF
jgi:long-chain fatty acid transport protein